MRWQQWAFSSLALWKILVQMWRLDPQKTGSVIYDWVFWLMDKVMPLPETKR